MLKKASIPWNARQLSKMIEKGNVVFDSAVQRGLVWDDKRKSLLIHSMMEGYPVPVMYAAKDENKKYSMLDGKQRSNCIHDFLNDKFALKDIPEVTMEDGSMVDVNGKLFSEIDEELQDRITNYSLTIHYFEDITDEEIAELFFRLNNGKCLSQIELSRSKCKCLEDVQEVGKHELFTTALTEKAFERYTHEDLVVKSYIMLTQENPCIDTKEVRPIMERLELSDKVIDDLNSVFDRILASYKIIISDDNKDNEKVNKRIAKRLLTRTHMLSIIPIVKKSIDDGITEEKFAIWVKELFSGKKAPTKYDQYNVRCASGSGHLESIRVRLEVIEKDYDKFMKENVNKDLNSNESDLNITESNESELDKDNMQDNKQYDTEQKENEVEEQEIIEKSKENSEEVPPEEDAPYFCME